ncbi:hypothetical protein JCM5350_005956 [Sporobolomyces pararoseus]
MLAVVNRNLNLAALVKVVRFRRSNVAQRHPPSNVFTCAQALISTAVNLFGSAESFIFHSTYWLLSSYFPSFYPHYDRIRTIEITNCTSKSWFDSLRKLLQLRSLQLTSDSAGLPDHDPANPGNSLLAPLEFLSVRSCRYEQFETLTFGARTSLRTLKIAVGLLTQPYLVPSFPFLSHLALFDDPTPLTSTHLQSFLTDLLPDFDNSEKARTLGSSHSTTRLPLNVTLAPPIFTRSN